jgi:hypothetical protein
MRHEQVCSLRPEEFRRLTGIKRTTFDVMIAVLRTAEEEKRKFGGRPHKLDLEDRLLMTLEYLREYRPYFHIATSYGISESNCFQAIRWIENTLIACGKFSLPGRKALTKSDMKYEIILIDATETPIERPKKSKENSTQVRRKSTL